MRNSKIRFTFLFSTTYGNCPNTSGSYFYRLLVIVVPFRITKALNNYAKYKWHIITIFGYLASGITPPSIKNKKDIEKYTNLINAICCDDGEMTRVVEKIPQILLDIGLKDNRDEVRSASYTKQVLEYCTKKLLTNN